MDAANPESNRGTAAPLIVLRGSRRSEQRADARTTTRPEECSQYDTIRNARRARVALVSVASTYVSSLFTPVPVSTMAHITCADHMERRVLRVAPKRGHVPPVSETSSPSRRQETSDLGSSLPVSDNVPPEPISLRSPVSRRSCSDSGLVDAHGPSVVRTETRVPWQASRSPRASSG